MPVAVTSDIKVVPGCSYRSVTRGPKDAFQTTGVSDTARISLKLPRLIPLMVALRINFSGPSAKRRSQSLKNPKNEPIKLGKRCYG